MNVEGSAARLGIEKHVRAGTVPELSGSTTAHLERATGERSPATSPGGAAETVIDNLRLLAQPTVGFVHPEYGTVGSLQRIGVHTDGSPLTDMYDNAQSSRAQSSRFSHLYAAGHPIAKDDSGRAYVVVAHTQPDGTVVSLPFWNSSGGGGKGSEFTGNWYHYPGHSSSGWLGKLFGNWRNHYGSPVLQFYADQLNRHVGNISGPTEANYNAEAAKHIGVFSPQEDEDFRSDVNHATWESTPLRKLGAGGHWAVSDWLDVLSPNEKGERASRDEGWMEAMNHFGRHGNWLKTGLQFPVVKSMQKSWFSHAIWPSGR